MKNTPLELRLAEPGRYQRSFREGERVLLSLSQRWPRLEEASPGLRRVNRYYEALAQRWRKRWEGPLLEQARAAAERGGPPWRAGLDFTPTLLQDGLFSLYLDAWEDLGEKRPRRVRQGDAWRLPAGVPVLLRELLPRQRWWRGPVLEEVRRQISAQVNAGEAIYYEDWPALVSKRFSPDRFWLTREGAVVFYPPETIAPALEGFPSFLVKTAVEKDPDPAV